MNPRCAAPPRWLIAGWICVLVTPDCDAQVGLDPDSYVVQWGEYAYDSRSREGQIVKVACGLNNTASIRSDGQLFIQGPGFGYLGYTTFVTDVPPLPPGLRYQDIALASGEGAIAIRSDGSAIGWGWLQGTWPSSPPVVPPLPPGTRYLKVGLSSDHALLLRSDGAWVAIGANNFGQGTVPVLPPGVGVRDLQVSYGRSAILLADGTAVLFGNNQNGQSSAPPLPAGMGYVGMSAGQNTYTLLLRSDGLIEAFGDNGSGQCNVPALPSGLRYLDVAAGDGFGVALRSDQGFIVWGASAAGFSIGSPPAIPAGLSCKSLHAGQGHVVARLSDGSILSWGHNGFYDHYVPYRHALNEPARKRQVHISSGIEHSLITYSDGSMDAYGDDVGGRLNVPPLPPGVRYVKGGAGGVHSLALRSDGEVVAFGYNGFGACNVPPLPAGTTYVDMAVEHGHSVLLRSDGMALAFGDNTDGQCNIPPLPSGVTYVKAAVHANYTVLLRSDGTLAYCGTTIGVGALLMTLPQPPSGTRFVDIAATKNFAIAIASDNTVIAWGSGIGSAYWVPPPPLPTGVYYVEVQGAWHEALLRRSDGEVVTIGTVYGYGPLVRIPPLAPGTSYVQLSGFHGSLAARASSTCTYTGYASGCAGSMQAARLIPRDTPRIGRTLEVDVLDLPAHVAVMAMGFERPPHPVSLAPLGMPGCDLHIQVDGAALLAGAGHTAKFLLPIPDRVELVGLRFQTQALVLDPAAGNGLGAVMSDAAEGVIGFP